MGAASERSAPWARIAVLAALAALCGCAWASGGEYTVAGQVSLGPMCGGPQREGQSCDVDYADVEVRLLHGDGRQLASTRTDARGAFQFVAQSRDVKLRVMAPKVVRCPELALRLPLVATSPLTVACDSGRR